MTHKKMDIEKAREWANSGKGKPVIASRATQDRHDSEWQNTKIFNPKTQHKELRAAIEEANRFHNKGQGQQ